MNFSANPIYYHFPNQIQTYLYRKKNPTSQSIIETNSLKDEIRKESDEVFEIDNYKKKKIQIIQVNDS